jgi:hypothetical protein
VFHGPPPDGGASRRRAMRFTARPRVGGRRAAGRWRLCVLLQKVVCVSLDLTCFYWEVFWKGKQVWEISSFSFFFVRVTAVDDGKQAI